MHLDVDIEPTLRFPHMTSIDKQMDKSEGSFRLYMVVLAFLPQTDRQTENFTWRKFPVLQYLVMLRINYGNTHMWYYVGL